MFKSVARVRDEVVTRCRNRQIDLETITKVFVGLSVVDYIVFVRYDTLRENPIWGEFSRWSRSPSVYAPSETIVEIRYATHMNETWRRFVVCKELCHSLEVDSGTHVVTPGAVDRLVGAFSMSSFGDRQVKMFDSFESELAAEAGAIELLCPLRKRKQIIAAEGQPSEPRLRRLAEEFNLPQSYTDIAFHPKYIEAIETQFENG